MNTSTQKATSNDHNNPWLRFQKEQDRVAWMKATTTQGNRCVATTTTKDDRFLTKPGYFLPDAGTSFVSKQQLGERQDEKDECRDEQNHRRECSGDEQNSLLDHQGFNAAVIATTNSFDDLPLDDDTAPAADTVTAATAKQDHGGLLLPFENQYPVLDEYEPKSWSIYILDENHNGIYRYGEKIPLWFRLVENSTTDDDDDDELQEESQPPQVSSSVAMYLRDGEILQSVHSLLIGGGPEDGEEEQEMGLVFYVFGIHHHVILSQWEIRPFLEKLLRQHAKSTSLLTTGMVLPAGNQSWIKSALQSGKDTRGVVEPPRFIMDPVKYQHLYFPELPVHNNMGMMRQAAQNASSRDGDGTRNQNHHHSRPLPRRERSARLLQNAE